MLDRRDRSGLISNVLAAILAVLVTNGFIALVVPAQMTSAGYAPLEPPGYVIGIVWVILFACMGIARWLVLASPGGTPSAAKPVLTLLLFCLAYPVYTLGLNSAIAGLIGNILTIVFAVFVAWKIRRMSPTAATLIAPVIVWVTFATYLTIYDLRS